MAKYKKAVFIPAIFLIRTDITTYDFTFFNVSWLAVGSAWKAVTPLWAVQITGLQIFDKNIVQMKYPFNLFKSIG